MMMMLFLMIMIMVVIRVSVRRGNVADGIFDVLIHLVQDWHCFGQFLLESCQWVEWECCCLWSWCWCWRRRWSVLHNCWILSNINPLLRLMLTNIVTNKSLVVVWCLRPAPVWSQLSLWLVSLNRPGLWLVRVWWPGPINILVTSPESVIHQSGGLIWSQIISILCIISSEKTYQKGYYFNI